MQRVTKDGTLDFTRAPKLPLLSPKLSDATTATDGNIFATEHRQVWFEYYLNQAVDLYGVAAIVASTDAQYLAELEMDYVGFAEETTQMGCAQDSGLFEAERVEKWEVHLDRSSDLTTHLVFCSKL